MPQEEKKKLTLDDVVNNTNKRNDKPVKAENLPEKKKSSWEWTDKNTQQLLVSALPTLLGGIFGGNQGASVGSQIGLGGLKGMAYADQKEKQEAVDLAKDQREEEVYAKADKRYKDKMDIEREKLALMRNRYNSGAKETPGKIDQKKFGAEERKRFDNILMAKTSLNDMAKALAAGENTFSLVGDNNFTRSATAWEEAIGRMQSGGAINAEEGKRFRSLIPGVGDSKAMQITKLKKMNEEMQRRFGSMGLNPNQEPLFQDKSFEQALSIYGGQAMPQMLDTANAMPGKKDIKQMTIEELKMELGGQ